MFVALGWFIIWTPPYCPKFQPIELVWGLAKQRAARLWYKGRTLAMTLKHLRFGFYGGVPRVGWSAGLRQTWRAACGHTAYGEMDKWTKGDLERNADGLMGTIGHLEGLENWTGTTMSCLAVDRGRPGRGQGHQGQS